MAVMITAWNEEKTVMDWLADKRCNPELTYDVLRRRLARGGEFSIPEIAITHPVIKGAQTGDTKARIKEREKKALERYKGFVLAKKVREKYNAGVDRAEIKERYDISESQLQKIISGQMYFNTHWDECRPNEVPEHFNELKRKSEYLPGSDDLTKKYEVANDKS